MPSPTAFAVHEGAIFFDIDAEVAFGTVQGVAGDPIGAGRLPHLGRGDGLAVQEPFEKALGVSRALGYLDSAAACNASVAVMSTGSVCHTMKGARIGAPVFGSTPTSRSSKPKAKVC